MVRCILLIGISVFTAAIAAAESYPVLPVVSDFPSDFSYRLDPSSDDSKTLVGLTKIRTLLENKGYAPLDPSNRGKLLFFWVDQVYFDSELRRTVLVKFDLIPTQAGGNPFGKIYRHPQGYAYTTRTASGQAVTFFFHSIGLAESTALIENIEKLPTFSKHASHWINRLQDWASHFTIRDARAVDRPGGLCPLPADLPLSKTNIDSLNHSMRVAEVPISQTFPEWIMPCIGSALSGARDAPMAKLTSIKDLGSKLAHPVQLWNSVISAVSSLKHFVADLPKTVSEGFKGFMSLPPEVKAELICGLIGSLGVDALIAFVTAGAASATFIQAATSYLSRLARIDKLIHWLSTTNRFSGSKEIRSKLFKNLFKLPERRLETINVLSETGLMDLAQGAAACGL